MSANAVFLVVLVSSFFGMLAFIAGVLKFGLQWRGVARIGWWKALGLHFFLTFFSIVICIVVGIAVYVLNIARHDLPLQIVSVATVLAAQVATIALMYKVRVLRAGLALVPYFITSFLLSCVITDVTRRFVYESFYVPTNSMAPTVLGEHLTAACPRCGAPAYGATGEMRGRKSGPVLMVCSQELKSVSVESPPNKSASGDRLLACKLLEPRRWDLIVFRTPQDPTGVYTKRVVGMPGEKLAIHDGAVWINGERMQPPEPIQNILFESTINVSGNKVSGAGSEPVELGPDEYFVLGDFVDGAFDSRFWQQGAPGHPPYAVPASHVVGVVINIYWPISRWTSFR